MLHLGLKFKYLSCFVSLGQTVIYGVEYTVGWDQVMCLGRKWDNLTPSPAVQGSRVLSHRGIHMLEVGACPLQSSVEVLTSSICEDKLVWK